MACWPHDHPYGNPLRILIVDDSFILRLAIRQLLLNAWPEARVDEATTLQEAVDHVSAAPAHLVVLDLSLPDASGLEGPTRLLRQVGDTPILVLSLNAEPAYATRLMQIGVAGYLTKGRASEQLVVAVRTLLEGGRYVDPALATG
jgi:DNA-binding NarL/FixJ family response regulator